MLYVAGIGHPFDLVTAGHLRMLLTPHWANCASMRRWRRAASAAHSVCESNKRVKALDLTGQRFGRLVVRERAADHWIPSLQARTCWSCDCDCGKPVVVLGTSLRSGRTQSCGCLRAERSAARLAGNRYCHDAAVRRRAERAADPR